MRLTNTHHLSHHLTPLRSPFFDHISLALPGAPRPLVVSAPGADSGKPYVAGVAVDGVPLAAPVIRHEQIARGAHIAFSMSATPQAWGSETLVRAPHVLRVQDAS